MSKKDFAIKCPCQAAPCLSPFSEYGWYESESQCRFPLLSSNRNGILDLRKTSITGIDNLDAIHSRSLTHLRFHTNQGLVLAIAQFAWTFVSRIIVSAVGAVNETVSLIIGGVCSLVNIAFAVLTVIGIINAAKGTAKELPIIGNIKILK